MSAMALPYAFGPFTFDLDRRELLESGQPVKVSPKAFQLLRLLIESRPRAVSKTQIQEALWPDTFVDECNVHGLVSELRAALGDPGRAPRYIRTLHKFGYSFSGAIEGAVASGEPAVRGLLVFEGRELLLAAGTSIIGRDATAEIEIDHSTVSRRHAAITIDADRNATLQDLSSKNGTFVRGARLDSAVPLRDGETFLVGAVQLLYRRSRRRSSTRTLQQA